VCVGKLAKNLHHNVSLLLIISTNSLNTPSWPGFGTMECRSRIRAA